MIRTFILTSGRLFGRPLKLTAVAAMDIVTNRSLAKLGVVLTRLFNSKLLQGHFRLQALAAPFKVWAEGPVTPLSEEVPELRELNEPDLEDREARMKVLANKGYRERFRYMWTRGRKGWSLARLGRLLNNEKVALTRELRDMVVSKSPLPEWVDDDLETIYHRLVHWQRTGEGARSDDERAAFESAPRLTEGDYVGNDAEFLMWIFERFDTELGWWSVTANRDPATTKRLVTDPQILPGFNDSGAHLTNMAFYDANLRGLRMVEEDGLAEVARHVQRLTSEPAEFFGVEGIGQVQPGFQADLVLIDPVALRSYDGEAGVEEIYRELFEHSQLVNRSDGVVNGVWIAGRQVWDGADFKPALGQERLGRCLTAGAAPSAPASEVSLGEEAEAEAPSMPQAS